MAAFHPERTSDAGTKRQIAPAGWQRRRKRCDGWYSCTKAGLANGGAEGYEHPAARRNSVR